jgi:hypothetical protein
VYQESFNQVQDSFVRNKFVAQQDAYPPIVKKKKENFKVEPSMKLPADKTLTADQTHDAYALFSLQMLTVYMIM